MKRLIVTGDDFGLAIPVNEAIEEAHRSGILTTASLMVGAEATADAIERARRLPSLKVGLHVVLVEGRPLLPSTEIPDLVDKRGEFLSNLTRAGFKFFFSPGIRKQLESEIRAQFQAFHETGIPLDHVNAHNHLHLHPTVLGLLLKVGRKYGLRAVRLPYEPPLSSWRASRKFFVRRFAAWLLLSPCVAILKLRLRRAHVHSNKYVFGMFDTGAMMTDLVLRILRRLPEDSTEVYFHPATRRCPEIDRTMPDYQHEQELEALINPEVRKTIADLGIQTIAFSDL